MSIMSKKIQKISRPGISMGDKFLKIIKLETYSGGLNTIVINIIMARKSLVLDYLRSVPVPHSLDLHHQPKSVFFQDTKMVAYDKQSS